MRLPNDLRLPVFRDLIGFVTPFAMRKILHEYQALTSNPTALPRCSKTFSTISGLPCKHIIQERIYTPPGVIKLADVHPHWRFKKPSTDVNPEPPNEAVNPDPHTQIDPADPDPHNQNDTTAPNLDPHDFSANDAVNSLLLVQNPPICRSKGRPVGALNRTRREVAFESSTQREPSAFEHVQTDVNLPIRRRGRPPGSGSRTRGSRRGAL